MCGHEVGEAVDECWITVGRGAPRYPLRPDLLPDVLGVLDVQLVQGLDVVIDEGDGDQHEVLLAPLAHHLDGLLRAGLQPGQRPHLALPH